MEAEALRAEIMSIWGMGRWSADMLSIFLMGQKRVWPENDVGLNNVARLVLGTSNPKKVLRHIHGHETACALLFWTSIETGVYAHLAASSDG